MSSTNILTTRINNITATTNRTISAISMFLEVYHTNIEMHLFIIKYILLQFTIVAHVEYPQSYNHCQHY